MWKGIVAKGFRTDEFRRYVASLAFQSWRPTFIVVHNTSAPRLSQWHTVPGEQRMRNLESFYRDEKGWSAGPHLFVADDLIWVFTPLIVPGVHSPSWNGVSWGVEMVGEYEEEPFNPAVEQNTIDALAVLHASRGISPDTIKFHKEDPRTTHKTCPGKHVDKAELIARVWDRLNNGHEGEHLADGAPVLLSAASNGAFSIPQSKGPEAGDGRFTNILATEFGGGEDAPMESAYGGIVNPDQPEAALPAKLPASKRQIRVYNLTNGKNVTCRINDVGPWNKQDKYWQTSGRPIAEAQFRNRTRAEDGAIPSNDAGLDLTPAAFEALGIPGLVNTRQAHLDWEFA